MLKAMAIILALFIASAAAAECPQTPCASCEHLRLYTQNGSPSGYYDISPDGQAVINAYCIMEANKGWTVIDPSHDSGWSQFFSSWVSRGPAYGPSTSPSYHTWASWFSLSAGATFATSENGTSITAVNQVYRMTGNYYGCYWFNGNCNFNGSCQSCNDPLGQYQKGTCPFMPDGPGTSYPHNCGFDWWNHGPSIGSAGHHLVAYAHQVEAPVPVERLKWSTLKARYGSD